MPRSSGTYTLPTPENPVSANTVIDPDDHNTTLDDIADALTASLVKDGQTTPTANLPMGGFKHTGAAAGTASGQYLLYGQSSADLSDGNNFGSTTFDGTLSMSAKAINGAVRVDVASAATVDLDAAVSNYVRITGTVTITAVTLTDGRWRDVVFSGALVLTNGASLILPGGVNITTAAGDTARVMGEAAGVVRVQYFSPASQSGAVIGYARTTSATAVSSALQIPYDDTIPQIGEGTALAALDTAYTVKRANSLLEVEFFVPLTTLSANVTGIVALFRDAGVDALQVIAIANSTSQNGAFLKVVVAATAIGSTTFKIRFGTNTGADTLYLLSDNGTTKFSTADSMYLSVREIAQ